MKLSISKIATYLLLLLAVVVSMLGCALYDDYVECPFPYTITVKAYAAVNGENPELGSETVGEVELLFFDKNETFLGAVQAQLNEKVPVDFPGHTQFHVVALGNYTPHKQGKAVVDGVNSNEFVLLPLTRADVLCSAPIDLFFGSTSFSINTNYVEQDVVLPIVRKVGQMNVTVKGINRRSGDTSQDYQVIVGRTYTSLDFTGAFKSNGSMAMYNPDSEFTMYGDLFVDDFNLFPSPQVENMTIDIMYKGNPFAVGINKDKDGNPIKVSPNEKLSILIVLNPSGASSVEVTVVPAMWGARIPIWKNV